MILGQKVFFWATGRRWKLKIFLNFVDSLWRHNTFMKYSFLSDINFIWRSFRNTHNFSKWTTQFVWISSKVSYFSYFKRISRDPNSENGRFWQKIFWRIFSVTDIYQIAKNKDFLRPAPFETAWFLQKVSLKVKDPPLSWNNQFFGSTWDGVVNIRKVGAVAGWGLGVYGSNRFGCSNKVFLRKWELKSTWFLEIKRVQVKY